MSVPIARPIAWISLVPQLGFTALLMGIYYLVGTPHFIFLGLVTYLVLSGLIQFFALKYHKQAMKATKAMDFTAAIPGFQSSYDFFNDYPWIDQYRYLVLLSSSQISYRETALNNIAFCYSQIGEGEKAITYYNRMLAEYPDSDLAKTALNFIAAIRKSG